jgi:pimeloyl-ACP methyl ester carboxylesterase
MKRPKFVKWLCITVAVVTLAFVTRAVLRHEANSGLNPLLKLVPVRGKPGATNLIVVVHAYNGSIQRMADVQKAIANCRPDAEILMTEYPAKTFSNADCFQIASNLCEEVSRRYESNHYASIEFVGYSMGALLARKAFVYGLGRVEDLSPDENAPATNRPPEPWAANGTVKRFVLLAGMNRGWTTRTRPRGMTLFHQFEYTAGKFIGWATDTGRLIRQCERGEPFVANLRMQWLEVVGKMPPEQQPTVIQLLGDTDDIVSDEDNRDVNVARNFVWVQMTATGHKNATDFHQAIFGPLREQKFEQALGDAAALERLRRSSPAVPQMDDDQVVEVVVVLHGIRDLGEWTSEFEDALQNRFISTHPATNKLCVFRPTYGYFPMGSFLLWPERQQKVRWFMDELTELKAKYPNAKKLHFIGHSNGTYVLASALRKYKSLKVDRVVFAGSVVRKDFDWMSPSLAGRVEGVRSYVGSKDLVVGWFPRLFEIQPFTWLNRDIGSAGFNGFTNPPGVSISAWTNFEKGFINETRYIQGGHGAAIGYDTNKIASIVSFIMDPHAKQPDDVLGPRSRFWQATSDASYLVWVIILVVLLVIGSAWAWVNQHVFWTRWNPRLIRFLSWATYGCFIWYLLETV